jgi:hypothetical protein
MADFVAGEILSAANLNAALENLQANDQSGATYTLAIGDAGEVVSFSNSGSAVTVTVPPNSSVAFATGAVIGLYAASTAVVTVAAGSGVTVSAYGSANKIVGQYAMGVLWKTGTNAWTLGGAVTS